jgi:hypothetical protein
MPEEPEFREIDLEAKYEAIDKRLFDPEGLSSKGLEMVDQVLKAYGFDTYFIIATNSQSYDDSQEKGGGENTLLMQAIGNAKAIAFGLVHFATRHDELVGCEIANRVLSKALHHYAMSAQLVKKIFGKEGGEN